MRLIELVPSVFAFKMFRAVGFPKLNPVSLTVSVTNQCNSRCRTCNIWKLYPNNPQLKNSELTSLEFERIFEGFGKSLFWVTISGGEPYLRQDLVNICKIIYESSEPKILIIPTNGLLPDIISKRTRQILDIYANANVIVNLSLDGIETLHDEIRGVKSNFEKALETYRNLKALKKEYNNFELGVHSVVSRFNVGRLQELYKFVKNELSPGSYICEFAEHRSELFNKNENIAPDLTSYQTFIENLIHQIKKDYLPQSGIAKIIQAFRLEYYNLTLKELTQKRQVIPCYAGFTTCQLSAYGDVWPCCILAYEANMGNLRENEYSFRKIWLSGKAERIRKMIKAKACYCPMANMHYLNMLCDTKTMLKIVWNAANVHF